MYPHGSGTQINVDLKWSLWSTHDEPWGDEGWSLDMLKRLVDNHEVVTIKTAPRKEIRYGTVTMWREGDIYLASVTFEEHWDDMVHLVDDASLHELAYEWFYGDNMVSEGGALLGARIERRIQVDGIDWSAFIEAIDACENDMIEQERERSKAFAEFLATDDDMSDDI